MASFAINLSHDVDRVRKTFQYVTHDLRRGRFANVSGIWAVRDPYWMFEHIMALEDQHGVRSTFFFLEESMRPDPRSVKSWVLALGRYRFDDPPVAAIIRKLDAQGWDVGLHGSYNSFRSLDLLQREKAQLEAVLGKPVLGGRQHYLNLDVPETWQLHRQVGLGYDASFGHKRGIGWRDECYRPFVDSASGIFVIPLALMDCNLFSGGRGATEIWAICEGLIDEAERNGAVLSVLWHQRVFNEIEFPGWAAVYERIIVEGKRRGAEFLTCREIYMRAHAHESI